MAKSEGLRLIEHLRDVFRTRSRRRDGTLEYLKEVYRVIRQNRSWIGGDIDLELTREPRTPNIFAHMLEVTSDFDPTTRSKYANVLQIADKLHTKASDFEALIKNNGGFNAVIKMSPAKRRKSIPRKKAAAATKWE